MPPYSSNNFLSWILLYDHGPQIYSPFFFFYLNTYVLLGDGDILSNEQKSSIWEMHPCNLLLLDTDDSSSGTSLDKSVFRITLERF